MRLAHTRISVRATRTQDGFDFCPESDVVLNVLRAACSRAGVPFQEVVSLPDAFAPDTQRKLRERAKASAKAGKPDDGPVIMDQDEVFALWGCPAPVAGQPATGGPVHRKGRPLVRGVVPIAAPAVAAVVEPAPERDPGRWGTSNGRDEPCRLMDELRRQAASLLPGTRVELVDDVGDLYGPCATGRVDLERGHLGVIVSVGPNDLVVHFDGEDRPRGTMRHAVRAVPLPVATGRMSVGEISSQPVEEPSPDLAVVEEISPPAAVEPAPSGARIRGWGMRGRAAPCAVGAGVLVDPERLAPRRSEPAPAPKPAGRKARKATGGKLKAPPRVAELAAMSR